jgi:putative transposase
MPRVARAVVEGVPYHVTQRGNRREDIFFGDEDRQKYLEWLLEYSGKQGLKIWAYCLMTNHIHLVAVPQKRDPREGDASIAYEICPIRKSQEWMGWSSLAGQIFLKCIG